MHTRTACFCVPCVRMCATHVRMYAHFATVWIWSTGCGRAGTGVWSAMDSQGVREDST